jgi:hypothetical protein
MESKGEETNMTTLAAEPVKAPSTPPPTEKHYWPLMQIKGISIGRCSQVLPNRLQCWRAGDFLVSDNLPTGKVLYQLCRTHTTLQKLADKLDHEKIAAGESIQVPAAYELPQPPTTLEAIEKLESLTDDPNAVYPPPIVLSAEQLKDPKMIYGTPLAESLTQPTDPKKQISLEQVEPAAIKNEAEQQAAQASAKKQK